VRTRRVIAGRRRGERIFRSLSIITGPACLLRRGRCLGCPRTVPSNLDRTNIERVNVDEPRALHCCARKNIFCPVFSRRRVVRDTTTLYPVTSLSLSISSSLCIVPTIILFVHTILGYYCIAGRYDGTDTAGMTTGTGRTINERDFYNCTTSERCFKPLISRLVEPELGNTVWYHIRIRL
jgi:hypothetical protein